MKGRQRYEPQARDGSEKTGTGCERLTQKIIRGIKQLEGLKANLFLSRRRPRERASRLDPYGDDGVRCADESAVANSEKALRVVTILGWTVGHIPLSSLSKSLLSPNPAHIAEEIPAPIEKTGWMLKKMFVVRRWRPSPVVQVNVTSQKLAIPIVTRERVRTRHALVDKIQR